MNRGIAIIIVGTTGSGKTTISKRLCAEVHETRLLIYDVNGEYYDRIDYELPDMDDFLDEAIKARERLILFEEATVFFSNRGSNAKMRKILVAKRHNENIIVLNFHSIRAIPHYIYDLVNFVIVLKTNDQNDLVLKKHELLYPAFREVAKMPDTVYPKVSMKIVKI
jgi:molybdopterin-guanine dinucleotide biosynthesis protein